MPLIPGRLLNRAGRVKRFGPAIVDAFRQHNLQPSWGYAFARVESDFKPWATNTRDAGDVARGGSWGMFMMSLQTARQDLGYHGGIADLRDLVVNADLAAQFIANLSAHSNGNLADVAARYNSGRPLSRLPLGHRTRIYVADLLNFRAAYAWADLAGVVST